MVDYFCNLRGKFNTNLKKCDCSMGYSGDKCEQISCNGNGITLHEKCYCYKDFSGTFLKKKIIFGVIFFYY